MRAQHFFCNLLLTSVFLAVAAPLAAEASSASGLISDLVFADRFDDCTLQNWSGVTNLSDANVGRQGDNNKRYSGECGLRIPIDTSTVRTVVDDSLYGEQQLILRFYANFDGYDDQDLLLLQAAPSSRFQIRYNHPTPNDISLEVRAFNGALHFLTFENIGMGWHSIELIWEAGDSATISFSVNSVYDKSMEVNTSGHTVEQIAIGTLNPAITGNGYVDIDAYDSRRVSRPGRLLVGDADADTTINVGDIIAIADELDALGFAPGQPDCDEDGEIEAADVSCVVDILDNQ